MAYILYLARGIIRAAPAYITQCIIYCMCVIIMYVINKQVREKSSNTEHEIQVILLLEKRREYLYQRTVYKTVL
jgi:hypothetical protein